MCLRRLFVCLVFSLLACLTAWGQAGKRRVIIDTDPGTDGAQHPLMQKLYTAQYWHGNNGLADLQLPASKCKVDPRFGPDLIIALVHRYPHEITLVPVGPLTNIALAVLKDPSIVGLVNDIVIMGGSISGG